MPPKKKIIKRKLKAQIEKLVLANGCYVLFTNKSLVDDAIDKRIEKFREAIKIAGHKNFSTFQIYIYDANKIKDWCNEYIGAITIVQGFNGIHRPLGFCTWEKWKILAKASATKFQTDTTISTNISLIRDSIKNEKVIRITGHSGLGKTRLVLEAFNESSLKHSLVYFDQEGNIDISEVKNYILNYQDTQDGIIIVDNCDIKAHSIFVYFT